MYCARKYPVLLDDLEAAEISFMPIGYAPKNDGGPRHFGGELFERRTRKEDWGFRRWDTSWGIQVYTGIPSEYNGARWHDLDFTYQALCTAPNAVLACIDALVNTVKNPLLTLTKSGGLRFSCRIPDYLHPGTTEEKQYIYKYTPTSDDQHQQDVYLEIHGEKGYNRWDARYEILVGDLLNPPVIAQKVLFALINALRVMLHVPVPVGVKQRKTIPAAPLRLGSYQLDIAKEAFMKRGFSYLRYESGCHYWIPSGTKADDNVEVSLWEEAGTVWIRASTPDIKLPTTAMPITDVWDDTGIVPPVPATGLPATDKVIAVRQGVSPLSIKRPSPILKKMDTTEKAQDPPENNVTLMRRVIESPARILRLTVSETDTANNYATELLNSSAICLIMPTNKLAEEAEHHFQAQNEPSVIRWKDRMHLWEQVKHIPANERMTTPFQHGNVCEDPERCDALMEKGGNPDESICPECPIYTECQDRGYLSQRNKTKHAKTQITTIPHLFFNPQYNKVAEKILETVDETERLCIVNERNAPNLFLKCMILRNVLEDWDTNWRGSALGNFAIALLNVLNIKDRSHSDAVKGVRATIKAFEWQQEELTRQMCHVNVKGKVVERTTVDTDTGEELARFTIDFEGGSSAHIPVDNTAAAKLKKKGIPVFTLESFAINEDIKIPVQMTQAIQLGILDTKTAQSIQEFPTVYSDPNWTFWHQIKNFFAHYTRDADAPIRWDGDGLHFWVPPILHGNVKRLVVMSPTLSEQHLQRVFPHEKIESLRTEPTPWATGNQVFQIRTSIYPRETILDYDNTWDVIGVSKTGQRFLLGIRAEIEKDPTIKHAIITDSEVIKPLQNIAAKENVSFLGNFQKVTNVNVPFEKMDELETAFETAQVIWIVGAPERPPGFVWRRAQILCGNHEKPLSYKTETGSNSYTDERVQNVYEQEAVSILTEIFEGIRLNHRTGKKVVLITGLRLPYITDRPETLLFDWEDFEVAGGLENLPEAIITRQRFEAESGTLSAESSREEVERILGCSSRQANRILRKFRGGKPFRVPLREQILTVLANGNEKTAEIVAAVEGYPSAIQNELKRLVDEGEVIKVRRSYYALSEDRKQANKTNL